MLKICFGSTTLKSNQVHKLQVKEGITDLKSERLQSDQQPEQDVEILTKKRAIKMWKVQTLNKAEEKEVVADENGITKNLQAYFFFLCMTIIIDISIQEMLVFVDSLKSYQSLVADLQE